MALSVKTSRAGCLITHTDGVAETTINVQPTDPTDAILAKFRKAIELEDPPRLPFSHLVPDLKAPPVTLRAEVVPPPYVPEPDAESGWTVMTDEEAARLAAEVPDTVLPPEEAAGGPTGPEAKQYTMGWGHINDEDLPPAPREE